MDSKKAQRMARFGSDGAPTSNKRPAGAMEGVEQAAKQPRLGEAAEGGEEEACVVEGTNEQAAEGSENPEGL
jgi:hypothetical protein